MDTGMGAVAVGKAAMLLVAGGARHRPVRRQIGVVEQPPPELGLGRRGRIVGRHARLGQADGCDRCRHGNGRDRERPRGQERANGYSIEA